MALMEKFKTLYSDSNPNEKFDLLPYSYTAMSRNQVSFPPGPGKHFNQCIYHVGVIRSQRSKIRQRPRGKELSEKSRYSSVE